jgi:cytoskeletal protein CcmA (bactofilin family)
MLGAEPFFRESNPSENSRLSTYLGSDSYILGEHSFGGDAHIEGVVIGDISAAGRVTIGEGGRVSSQIRASSVVVAGKVTGDIVGSERIEICRTATVFGNLNSPTLLIEAGAGVEGHLSTVSEKSSYNHHNESELVQMGFPFFKASEQRVITVGAGLTGYQPSDANRTPRRWGTRDVLARVRTIPCAECLQPIRWWNRRIWLVDGERCAHLQCWKSRLFFKALVADQIRSSQLMAGENSALSRNGSAESELHASA